MKVNFHIERLTVDGASPADARRIGDALRARLAELASNGLRVRTQSVERIEGGEAPYGAGPEHIAKHAAGRIVQGLKGTPHV
jgi:hypothetical protein